MTTRSAEKLWKLYPEGHLHCEVMEAGPSVYKIVMSMFDGNGSNVGTIEHTGSGSLPDLKTEALQRLLELLTEVELPVE